MCQKRASSLYLDPIEEPTRGKKKCVAAWKTCGDQVNELFTMRGHIHMFACCFHPVARFVCFFASECSECLHKLFGFSLVADVAVAADASETGISNAKPKEKTPFEAQTQIRLNRFAAARFDECDQSADKWQWIHVFGSID